MTKFPESEFFSAKSVIVLIDPNNKARGILRFETEQGRILNFCSPLADLERLARQIQSLARLQAE